MTPREIALTAALQSAADALLMLSITGSNELPSVSWQDDETEIPVTVEQLQEVLEARKAEAERAWREAIAALAPSDD